MAEKPRIGFIGLGMMGRGMARNLLAKGFPLITMAHRRREALAGKGAVRPCDDYLAGLGWLAAGRAVGGESAATRLMGTRNPSAAGPRPAANGKTAAKLASFFQKRSGGGPVLADAF